MLSHSVFASLLTLSCALSIKSPRPDLTKRGSYTECATALYQGAFNDPLRPHNANAVVCYSGRYLPANIADYAYRYEGTYDCYKYEGLIKHKNEYGCWYLSGTNSVHFSDDTGEENLAFWYNPQECTWDKSAGDLNCFVQGNKDK